MSRGAPKTRSHVVTYWPLNANLGQYRLGVVTLPREPWLREEYGDRFEPVAERDGREHHANS